ncbi:hypothetical protein ACI2K4_02995 [Micromonospora sp. NPDC050397]|uniref:hypothetical protein n=1 Tax=Micromonospora sp. NPDC050397 TaxID=3364279 RepID=UPI00384B8E68
MTTTEAKAPSKHFGRTLGIGVLIQIVVIVGTYFVVRFTSLGDDGLVGLVFFFGIVGALDALVLIVEIILVAIPATRARIGSGPGLLLGWLLGFILQLLPFIIINLT